jgi:hypothetical protein
MIGAGNVAVASGLLLTEPCKLLFVPPNDYIRKRPSSCAIDIYQPYIVKRLIVLFCVCKPYYMYIGGVHIEQWPRTYSSP